MMKLQPESSGSFQERDQGAVNVTSHESFDTAQELATHKDNRDRMLAAGELVQDGLHFGAILLLVELHDSGSYSKAEKQLFHHVAHAAAADAEHHHRIAGAQPPHRLIRGLRLLLGFTAHPKLFLYHA
ncbi:hypothetical protein PVL29_013299 [Vitis rotundifolia]|uniref:Uncharacterized protein n=1 Tax=Vitis rotundifolia TaxID=103349 RepID=A0AA39DP46_VITRO|nr:hypothetical protein PVL29_013299 [Vitis rotundifolia]